MRTNFQIIVTAFAILVFYPCFGNLYAEEFGQKESKEILDTVDKLITYKEHDFSAEYTVTEMRPGQGTSRTMMTVFRRDRTDTYTIIIMEPERDKGKGYLRKDDKMWLYDPAARRFTVVNVSDRFQNTNLRNSDFTKSTLSEDYRITGHTRNDLGVYDTNIYDLEAVTEEVTFPKIRIWVDQDHLLRKKEDYSLSGRHMRTTAIPNYRKIENRYVPVRIVIQDELRGRKIDGELKHQRTLINVDKPSFQEVPDMVFTRAYLERVSQ